MSITSRNTLPLAVNFVNSQTSVIGTNYTKTPPGKAPRTARMDMLYFNCDFQK